MMKVRVKRTEANCKQQLRRDRAEQEMLAHARKNSTQTFSLSLCHMDDIDGREMEEEVDEIDGTHAHIASFT